MFNNLRSLTLNLENISTTFAADIAVYLGENKKLRHFGPRYSCGDDGVAVAIIEALTLNNTLKKFTLA